MSFLIQNEIASELLTDEEVRELTGASRFDDQVDWLKNKGWQFSINRKNKVKIGRWYARIKLSGISPEPAEVESVNLPNFHKAS